MNITLIQSDIVWENSKENIDKYNLIISKIDKSDLVIFPEMFTSGFSMNVHNNAETLDGTSVSWMKEVTMESGISIIGSLPIIEKNEYYNRLVMASGDEISCYDKRHLFTMGNEQESFTPGNERKIFKLNNWRILPQVCYDLRFPVWSRNRNDYDLLVNIANWPAARAEVWTTLLKARAIENQSYVVGVNRIGKDGNGISYSGNSMVIDPKGKVILDLKSEETYGSIDISLDKLKQFRKAFPVIDDADDFSLLI